MAQHISFSTPTQPSLNTSAPHTGSLQNSATRVHHFSQQVGINTSRNTAFSQYDSQTAAFLDFRAVIATPALDAALKDLSATAGIPISQSSSQSSSPP